MPDSATDTIAAIATPAGRGGVGIVRISGPASTTIAAHMIGQQPPPRQACFCRFLDQDAQVIDTGLALYFPAPHSFTGEDVLELQGHGGPVVMDMLMQRILALGVRAARPGEFSERAFLNDKIDLAQAEAIADLIDSGTTQAARAAQNSLQGEFSQRIHALVEAITSLRMYVEAAIDFPEEEVDFLSDGKITTALEDLLSGLEELFASARQGCLLKEGMHVVIAGRPNAGKSSLLNQLAGHDTAIVTEVPGTTRDVLRVHIQIDGMPLHVIDTAGLRDSSDVVEREGMRRAWEQIENSDRLLLLIDDSKGMGAEEDTILKQLPANLAVTRVFNKIDLSGHAPGETADGIHVSAKTGDGIDQLREHLKQVMGYVQNMEGSFSARRRHLDALERARTHIESGKQQLETARAGELLAEELRQAQQALGEITGEVSSDDLLGKIFSSFCIGK